MYFFLSSRTIFISPVLKDVIILGLVQGIFHLHSFEHHIQHKIELDILSDKYKGLFPLLVVDLVTKINVLS
jgi:hypothetical protein